MLSLASLGAALSCGCSLLAFDDMSSDRDKTAENQTVDGRREEEKEATDTDPLTPASSQAPDTNTPSGPGADAGAGDAARDGAPLPKDGGPREMPPPQVSPCTTVENADDDVMDINSADVTVCGQMSTAADLDSFRIAFGGGGGSGTVKVVPMGVSGSLSIVFRRPAGDIALAANQEGSVTSAGGSTAKLEVRAGSATVFPARYYAIIKHQDN